MTRVITLEERRRRLAERHRLLPARRTDDVRSIAEDLVALHSSDPVTVYLSAMVRMREPSVEAVSEALYERRSLLRHHAMRRTLWVATPETTRAMHAAATRKLIGPERRRTVRMLEESGVRDGDTWLADAQDEMLKALREHGPAAARRLGDLVPGLRQPLQLAPGKRYAATQSAHTRVLMLLAMEGAAARTRPTGSWVNGQYTWAAMDDWLPGGVDGLEERASARDLADHWLRSFGPGTTTDLQWWTGWTGAMTRRALEDCGAVEVGLDVSTGWLAATDAAVVAEPAEPWVALLPGLDPTTMGWKERGWYVEPAVQDVFDRNGNAGPTIWADGRVVGAWAQAPDGDIRIHLFVDVGKARRTAIAERVGELRAMLGETRFTVRFPGTIQPVLLG
ncbi:MAG TPA: winged helix DNA-binding domain-containing protein [Nocardioidaceae bacterium]|nr:winged helix DNA-binding domain-containing protein [Nocardioidaceae bacterium]